MYIGIISKKIDEHFRIDTDSKIGGYPIWINNKEPTTLNLKCSLCKKDLTFLIQLSTSYEEYERVIYIFCCLNSKKCNIDKKSWLCIKGKKNIFDNNCIENNVGISYTNCNNKNRTSYNSKREMTFGSLMENNHNVNMNNYNDNNNNNNDTQGNILFDTFTENKEQKKNVVLEIINNKKQKNIDWDNLFSKNESKEKNNTTLFNAFSKSFNYEPANQNLSQNVTVHSLINGTSPCYFNATLFNNGSQKNDIYENVHNKNDTFSKKGISSLVNMHDKNQYDVEKKQQYGTSGKLPCYYIQIIEDDDEYCNDYLYEKAKQMHEHYEKNKQKFEDPEFEECQNYEEENNWKKGKGKKKGKENEEKEIATGREGDEEEKFENDLNGCIKFYSYFKKNYNQILRYRYKGKYLYMYKYTKNYLSNQQMKCKNCGSKLVFEFQFFQTLVYQMELLGNQKENISTKNMLNNFCAGNVFIFTCESDCVSTDLIYSYEHVELEIF